MKKENIVLADGNKRLDDFLVGLEEILHIKFKLVAKDCIGHRNFIDNLYRYMVYIFFPLKIFFMRKKFNIIIGWQQFFTIFYAFYCKLFHVKKRNIIVVCNFTYKEKKGTKGKIYKKIMHYTLNSKYIDFIHVLSNEYASICSKELQVNRSKFIVTHFGIVDMYSKWKNSKCEYNNYTLAIGRSNRDYNFLIDAWMDMPRNEKLLIISDELKIRDNLPENIIIRKDIGSEQQYKYIANCKLMIIPIKNEKICSGDTVLLTAMSFKKVVVVTAPSTLAEMYIIDNKNGILVEKNKKIFIEKIENLVKNESKMQNIAENARQSYKRNFSRLNMGRKIGDKILNESVK